jgi:hypothetical protein
MVPRLKSEVTVNHFIFHCSAPQNFAALLIETITIVRIILNYECPKGILESMFCYIVLSDIRLRNEGNSNVHIANGLKYAI